MGSQTRYIRKGGVRASKVLGLRAIAGGGTLPGGNPSVAAALGGDVIADEVGGLGDTRVVGILGRPLGEHTALGMIEIPWITGDDRATLAVGSSDTDNTEVAVAAYSGAATGIFGYGDTSTAVGVQGQTATGVGVKAEALVGSGGLALEAVAYGTGRAAHFHRNVSTATVSVVLVEQLHASNAKNALELYQHGTRYGIYAEVSNSGSNFPAIQGLTGGTGPGTAGRSNSSGPGVYGSNFGTGPGVYAFIDDSANNAPAVEALTNGTGNGGFFEVDNTGNSQAALAGLHNGAGPSVYGYNNGTGEGLRGDVVDSGTTGVRTVMSVRRHSTGTPGVGFGMTLDFVMESGGANDVLAAQIEASWNVATHASREGRLRAVVYDSAGTAREGWAVIADNATGAPKLGFFGTVPVVRPNVPALAAGPAYGVNEQLMLNSVYTAFRALGLGA